MNIVTACQISPACVSRKNILRTKPEPHYYTFVGCECVWSRHYKGKWEKLRRKQETCFVWTSRVCLPLFVCLNGCVNMFVQHFHMIPCVFISGRGSCVCVTVATSPLFFVSLFLSPRQQQPHGPQDILDPSLHHTSSTPTLPKVTPTLFYTVTYSRCTDSALATPPLTPPWKVPGMHDKGAHTLCLPVDCMSCLM